MQIIRGCKPTQVQIDIIDELLFANGIAKKVQVGKDQEKAQSEKDSHSENRGGIKTKLTIRAQ